MAISSINPVRFIPGISFFVPKWWRSPRSEELCVAFDLPVADVLVVLFPLGALVADEFVAQLAAEHALDERIGGERVDRLAERAWQRFDADGGELRVGALVEVLGMRRARIEALADAFQPGRQAERGGEIRVE